MKAKCNGTACQHRAHACKAWHEGYSCTLARGHKGPHIACGETTHDIRSWPKRKRLTTEQEVHRNVTSAKRVVDLCMARPRHYNWKASFTFNALVKRVGFAEAMRLVYESWFASR